MQLIPCGSQDILIYAMNRWMRGTVCSPCHNVCSAFCSPIYEEYNMLFQYEVNGLWICPESKRTTSHVQLQRAD